MYKLRTDLEVQFMDSLGISRMAQLPATLDANIPVKIVKHLDGREILFQVMGGAHTGNFFKLDAEGAPNILERID